VAVRAAAVAVLLQPEGLKEMYGLINFYKENATILKNTFQEMGFEVYGEQRCGTHCLCSASVLTCMSRLLFFHTT
jgi:redox-regulated HSP33 family molecular chaperone